jgi:hypothetical protein
MTDLHYRYYVRPRAQSGFLMFYGHGALLRTEAWHAVGGFPEIATEDLAFTARLRECGFRGAYTEAAASLEDFPPAYARLRLRMEKWIRGTAQCVTGAIGGFLRSSRVAWFEKLDLLANAFSHFQGAVMLVCLLMLGILLPEYFSHFRYPGSFFLMPVPHGQSAADYLLHIRYHIFWSWDFYLLMLASLAAPILPAMIELRRSPRLLWRYLAASHWLFLASMVADTAALLVWLATGRAVFRGTNDAESSAAGKRGYHPNHALVWAAELLASGLFFYLGWRTKNLWFWSPGAALLSSPLVARWGMESRLMRSVVSVPLVLTLLVVAVVTMDLVVTGRGR